MLLVCVLADVAGDGDGGSGQVSADAVGVDDADVILIAVVNSAGAALAAGDDHGVSLVQGCGGVLAQLEAGLDEVRRGGVVGL